MTFLKFNNLYNYEFVHKPSKTSAGGVGLYVKQGLVITETQDYDLNHPDCEDLWINLKLSPTVTFIIGIIYKHPRKDIPKFTEKLSNSLENLNKEKKLFILLGDFNINLLSPTTDLATMKYIDMLLANLSLPLITSPTRVTRSSSTLIDNIFTNAIKFDLMSFIILSDISDHYPQFCTVYDSKFKGGQDQDKILKRDMENFSIDAYRTNLESSLSPISNCQITSDNLNTLFETFIEIIRTTIDQ
uniref:uncharacterized protein LOC120344734 n=1 Tax=Styela clava TaxID=7725 RepID=UPI00193A2CE8|nr:uncharacterized protein LOC120344734 [Styela clava]